MYRGGEAGVFFLSDYCEPSQKPTINVLINVLCNKIKNVVASAAKAETFAIFLNAQHVIQIITAFLELGHLQPAEGTQISTYNSTVRSILTYRLLQKLSKASDMIYWGTRDRIKQKQFNLVWEPGKGNHAYYFRKKFPPSHHKFKHPVHIHSR